MNISLASPTWNALVHALLSTLWQGAAAAAVVWLTLRLVPTRYPRTRYAVAGVGLLMILLGGLASWAWPDRSLVRRSVAAPAGVVSASSPVTAVEAVNRTPDAPVAGRAIATPPPAPPWPQWISLTWMLGVATCLARTLRQTAGAARLRRRGEALSDPLLLALAEELRTVLRISRRVRLLVSSEIEVPAMMGLVASAILFPARMLTGLTLEDWRAVLAHELAHLRRWDYLVNLGQMLIEALLFFNPFVWWVSRQIRLEREACCDAIAATVCPSPTRYLHALVAVIEQARTHGPAVPAPLIAAAGHDGSVTDRAHRLLIPGYVPALRLRWPQLLLVLGTAGLVLAGAWSSTRLLAQTLITPAKSSAPAAPSSGTLYFAIKVRTEDGTPIGDGAAMAYATCASDHGTSNEAARVNKEGQAYFSVDEDARSVWFSATMEGYAPVHLGPLTAPLPPKLANVELTLTRGFTAAVRLQDEAGQPIPQGRVQVFYPGPPTIEGTRSLRDATATADAAGLVTMHHLGAHPRLRAQAAGFQTDETGSLPLDAATPSRWTLRKAQPLPGIVKTPGGQAVPDARIKLAGVRGLFTENYLDPVSAPVQATSDAQGRFQLTTLRPDSTYYFFIDAPGHGGVFLREVKTSAGPLAITLGPELTIRGRLLHVPPSVVHLGSVYVNYGQTFHIGDNFAGQAMQQQKLEEGGGYAFSAGPFYQPRTAGAAEPDAPGHEKSITLSVDQQAIHFNIEQLPVAGYTWDFDPTASRETIHCSGQLVAEDGTPLRGEGARVSIYYRMPEASYSRPMGTHRARLTESTRFLSAPAAGRNGMRRSLNWRKYHACC